MHACNHRKLKIQLQLCDIHFFSQLQTQLISSIISAAFFQQRITYYYDYTLLQYAMLYDCVCYIQKQIYYVSPRLHVWDEIKI